MPRTIAAAVAVTLLSFAAPAAAADPEPAAVDTTGIAAIDWSVPPPPAAAARGTLLPVLYVGFAGLNAYDAYSTTAAINAGAREHNPLVVSFADNRAAMWAMKGGVTAGSIFFAERLWKKNRKAAAISMMVISNSMMAIVAANNARVLGRQQR